MKYITSRELAEKWQISQRRIVRLAAEGRLEGAKHYGKSWVFPADIVKPADGRTKEAKADSEKKADTFRYPIFEFKDADSFSPPLTKEELTIKAFTEAVDSCRFDDAKALLSELPCRSQNRYIRITALYCGCMISILICETDKFLDYYGRLKEELSEEFEHKEEMKQYIYEIEASLGYDKYYSEEFHRIPAYRYHESFLPRLCNLSALRLAFGNGHFTAADLSAHEANCAFLEKTDNYFDLQALHICLACAYSVLDKKEECQYHFVRALQLAERYGLFYTPASMQYYYPPQVLDEALHGFSEELKAKVVQYSLQLHKNYIIFANALQQNSIYRLIARKDYIYIVFAVLELSNNEVAARMNISGNAVSRHYGETYKQLGVKNKAELVALYRRLTDKPADIPHEVV